MAESNTALPLEALFVAGIGPPLQQLEEDLRDSETGYAWSRDALALIAEVVRLRTVLALIKAQQPATLAKLEKHGIVFADIGNDPQNWEHIAFSIYTDLCEVDLLAKHALESE